MAWAVWTFSKSAKSPVCFGRPGFFVVPVTQLSSVRFHTRRAGVGVSVRSLTVELCITIPPSKRAVGLRCDSARMQTIGWPFRAAEALAAGALTFRELRRFHAPIYPGVWVPRGVDLSAVDRGRAAWLWSDRKAVLADLSASATLGAKWIEPDTPAELVHTNRRPPPLIAVHTDRLLVGETLSVSGMAVTTPARTAFDIGRRLGLEPAVQRIDALMNATDVKVDEVEAVMARHPSVRGLRQLRRALELVDGGSESRYESLTRIVLMQHGFPRPQNADSGARRKRVRCCPHRPWMAGAAGRSRLRWCSPLD